MTPRAFDSVRMSPGTLIKKPIVWLTVWCVSRCRYAARESLTTVIPGSMQSLITAMNVSGVLSGTGTRKIFTESRSTPPTPIVLLQLVPSGTCATVLLGQPILFDQPSMFQRSLLTELDTVRIGSGVEIMLYLVTVCLYTTHNIVCEEKNVHEIEVTLTKPGTVPNRGRNRTSRSKCIPPASSSGNRTYLHAMLEWIAPHPWETVAWRRGCWRETWWTVSSQRRRLHESYGRTM